MIITSALMIWKSLVLGTGSESPVGAAAAGACCNASPLALACTALPLLVAWLRLLLVLLVGCCLRIADLCCCWCDAWVPAQAVLGGSTEPGCHMMPPATCCLSFPPAPPVQVVVVLSGSMEPGFYRGDILFLYQPKQAVETGDISEHAVAVVLAAGLFWEC